MNEMYASFKFLHLVLIPQVVVCGMCLKFVYTNTICAREQREVQTADILIPIDVVLGKAE